MRSAPAFACLATSSCTLVPSHTVVFRQSSRARRLQSPHFAAPLFSYSYELLFGQTLWIHIHTNCPGVWGISPLYLATRHSPLATSPLFSSACSLFARSKKVNSFAIKQIQPLFRKCRGVGVGIPIPSLDSRRESTRTPGAGDATTGHPGWGYVNVQTACHTTWTRRTHPTIIAARSARLRSHVHG
jgi:hypothetical protein